MGKKPGVFPGLLYFGGGEKPSRSAKRACCRAGGLGRFFEAKNIALDSILSRKAFALLTSKKKSWVEDPALYFGGGENRTLVLSKRHDNDYMLIALC